LKGEPAREVMRLAHEHDSGRALQA
jgi:hypothetical protein